MAATGAIRAGRAFVELFADDSKLLNGLRIAEGRLKEFGQKTSAMGKQFATFGAIGAAPAAIGTKIFAGFDDQMRAVQAVTGSTGEAFEQLTEKAKFLGRTTSFTAKEVASGMLELGRAGFKSDEIDDSIANVMNLARATQTEIPRATEIAGNALRGFGLDASEMGRVADVLATTANNSAQTLDDLGEAFKYVAPIAKDAGMSLEDTAKSIGALANYGIKGSMAGTSLKNILTRMADPDIQAKYEQLGVKVKDTNGNLRNMADVLKDVGNATANMPNGDRLAIFKDLFDMRAMSGGAKLVSESFDSLINAIDNASGESERVAKQMDTGIGGSFRSLMSAAEGVAIAIGESVAPEVQRLTEFITANALKIVDWVKNNKDLIVSFTTISVKIAAISAGLFVFGQGFTAIASTISAVRGAVLLCNSAVGALTTAFTLACAHPVIAGLAAVAAVVAGITIAFNKAEESAIQLKHAMSILGEENQGKREEDTIKFAGLKKYSQKDNINEQEIAQASTWIEELTSRYGDLGISIDKVTGKIKIATDSQKKLLDAMNAEKLKDKDKVIEEEEANLQRLRDQEQQIIKNTQGTKGFITQSLRGIGQVFTLGTGVVDSAATSWSKKINEQGDKIVAQQKKIKGLKKEREAMAKGEEYDPNLSKKERLKNEVDKIKTVEKTTPTAKKEEKSAEQIAKEKAEKDQALKAAEINTSDYDFANRETEVSNAEKKYRGSTDDKSAQSAWTDWQSKKLALDKDKYARYQDDYKSAQKDIDDALAESNSAGSDVAKKEAAKNKYTNALSERSLAQGKLNEIDSSGFGAKQNQLDFLKSKNDLDKAIKGGNKSEIKKYQKLFDKSRTSVARDVLKDQDKTNFASLEEARKTRSEKKSALDVAVSSGNTQRIEQAKSEYNESDYAYKQAEYQKAYTNAQSADYAYADAKDKYQDALKAGSKEDKANAKKKLDDAKKSRTKAFAQLKGIDVSGIVANASPDEGNKGSEAKISKSSKGSFNAFDVLGMSVDWQRSNGEKQLKSLTQIVGILESTRGYV